MSLVGNLEDLGLGDILQILSLSRKSGVLSLRGRSRDGRIRFHNGQVVQATSSLFPENLGDLLLREGLVDRETLQQALGIQRQNVRPQRIGAILSANFGISSTAIDSLVKEQVEKIIFSFFAWTEGSFSFDLLEPEERAAAACNPLQLMLVPGLNPQWLALEGSRVLDEKRHRGESCEAPAESFTGASEKFPDDLPPAPGADTPLPETLFDIGAELLCELGETGSAGRDKGPESPGLHLLRGMLQELNNPALGGGIILLVLRFASELMNRAVIFLVKEKEIIGLGQFGIEIAGVMADARIRRTLIPRDEDSVFAMVLREMSSLKVRPGSGTWDTYLLRQLGGAMPEQIFLGPVISEGKVVAILYGDNLPEKKPIGDTEALEIFLSQAGLAMEKALLESRLRGEGVV
jgi:hypothetical protein